MHGGDLHSLGSLGTILYSLYGVGGTLASCPQDHGAAVFFRVSALDWPPVARTATRLTACSGVQSLFRELALPFYLAVTLREQGEWLVVQNRREEAEPLLVDARETFERLEAAPWLERLERAASQEAAAQPA
jgi:hypothetical protein